MRKSSSIFILIAVGSFGSLWFWYLFTSYRGSDHLAFVAVRCGIDDPETLGQIEVFLVSPWGSETPMRLEGDRIWRVARIRDSGKRTVEKIRVAFSPELSPKAEKTDWEISVSPEFSSASWIPATVSSSSTSLFLLPENRVAPFSLLPTRKTTMNWLGDGSWLVQGARRAATLMILMGIAFVIGRWLWRAAAPLKTEVDVVA